MFNVVAERVAGAGGLDPMWYGSIVSSAESRGVARDVIDRTPLVNSSTQPESLRVHTAMFYPDAASGPPIIDWAVRPPYDEPDLRLRLPRRVLIAPADCVLEHARAARPPMQVGGLSMSVIGLRRQRAGVLE